MDCTPRTLARSKRLLHYLKAPLQISLYRTLFSRSLLSDQMAFVVWFSSRSTTPQTNHGDVRETPNDSVCLGQDSRSLPIHEAKTPPGFFGVYRIPKLSITSTPWNDGRVFSRSVGARCVVGQGLKG